MENLEKFGFRQQGQEWVQRRNKLLQIALTGAGIFLTLFGIGAALYGTTGWQRGLVLVLFAGMGLSALLLGVRARTSIDLGRRAFTWNTMLGQRLLPFEQVARIRPVEYSVNGVYEGTHFEAVPVNATPNQRNFGRVSPSYQSDELAEEFAQALQRLMRRPA